MSWENQVLIASAEAFRNAPDQLYPVELGRNTALFEDLNKVARSDAVRDYPELLLEISIFDATVVSSCRMGLVFENRVNGALVENPLGWPIIKENPFIDPFNKARCLINQKTEAALVEFETFMDPYRATPILFRRIIKVIEVQFEPDPRFRNYVCLENQPDCPARDRLVLLYDTL